MADLDEVALSISQLKSSSSLAERYIQIYFNFTQILHTYSCNCVVILFGVYSMLKEIFRAFKKSYTKMQYEMGYLHQNNVYSQSFHLLYK